MAQTSGNITIANSDFIVSLDSKYASGSIGGIIGWRSGEALLIHNVSLLCDARVVFVGSDEYMHFASIIAKNTGYDIDLTNITLYSFFNYTFSFNGTAYVGNIIGEATQGLRMISNCYVFSEVKLDGT